VNVNKMKSYVTKKYNPILCGSVTLVLLSPQLYVTIDGVYELADGEKRVVSLMIKAEGEGKWRVQAKVANNMSSMVAQSCPPG
jgi:uncharacterized protein with ParB-like and HNH nuclease domain